MDQIVGAMKRVISEPDNVNDESSPYREEQNNDANYLAMDLVPQTDSGERPPAVVEMDDPMDMDNVNRETSENSTSTSSSLSDGNEHEEQMQRNEQMHRDSRLASTGSVSSVSSSVGTSRNGSGTWGWFDDVQENNRAPKKAKNGNDAQAATSNNTDAAAMAVTAPTYVLEESLSSQKLWKNTAGTRPPQPVEERAFYEKMWTHNFEKSQVKYGIPEDILTATSPISLSPFADGNFQTELSNYNISEESKQAEDPAEAHLMDRLNGQSESAADPTHPRHIVVNKTVKGIGSDSSMTVLVRGDNVFGTTVSKSFAMASDKGGPIEGIDTVNISIASYRVVESKNHGKYAQYLVIYREGSIRDTIGVWKRYSDFKNLSNKVTQQHESCVSVLANMSPLAITEENEVEHLPNAITSWRLLKKRQRWYRCLDAGYLSLKVFLLERFLHDILFESTSPTLLREFVGATESTDTDSQNSEL